MISVRDLSYAYPGEPQPDWALQDVSLELRNGEFLSIMGPTGAGKTTLCLALNGIVPQATGGRIRGNVMVGSLNTKRATIAALAQKVGVVFQNPEAQLFNLSVESEIAFGPESAGLPRAEIRKRVDDSMALMGLDHMRDRPPSQLSGGEVQRLAIASILAMSPEVLVLDEPSSNLDTHGRAQLMSAMRGLRDSRETTVIMVEHHVELIAEFSDRVALMDSGRLELIGRPDRVFAEARELGLGVPQVTEVAECLNRQLGTDLTFTQYEQSERVLSAMLESG